MANAESWTLLALALVFIGTRVYVRWTAVGPSNFQFDDYMMPVAGIVFILETVAAYLVGALFQGLTNSYMTGEQRHNLDPASQEYANRQSGSKVQVIGWSFYAFILWAIKFCLASYYSRLTSGIAHLRVRVLIAYGLLTVTYLFAGLGLLLSCQPFHHFWQISPDPGPLCRPTNSPFYVLAIVVPNILTDIYLLSIPLPLLWAVQISLRRKLTLMGLFSGAVFVIMAGTIRAVVILTAGPDGAITGSKWACRETFVAIVVSNLPVIQPLLRKGAGKIGLSALFSGSHRTTGGGPSHPLGSKDEHELGSRMRSKNARHQTALSVGGPGWDSDERVLVESGSGDQNRMPPAGSKDILVSTEFVVQSDGR